MSRNLGTRSGGMVGVITVHQVRYSIGFIEEWVIDIHAMSNKKCGNIDFGIIMQIFIQYG